MKFGQILLVVLLSSLAAPAFAYLDPGTGSMLLQVILGGIAAVGVALKLGWHKFRAALGFSKKPAADEGPFLKDEQKLLSAIAQRAGFFVQRVNLVVREIGI